VIITILSPAFFDVAPNQIFVIFQQSSLVGVSSDGVWFFINPCSSPITAQACVIFLFILYYCPDVDIYFMSLVDLIKILLLKQESPKRHVGQK